MLVEELINPYTDSPIFSLRKDENDKNPLYFNNRFDLEYHKSLLEKRNISEITYVDNKGRGNSLRLENIYIMIENSSNISIDILAETTKDFYGNYSNRTSKNCILNRFVKISLEKNMLNSELSLFFHGTDDFNIRFNDEVINFYPITSYNWYNLISEEDKLKINELISSMGNTKKDIDIRKKLNLLYLKIFLNTVKEVTNNFTEFTQDIFDFFKFNNLNENDLLDKEKNKFNLKYYMLIIALTLLNKHITEDILYYTLCKMD